MTTTGQAAWAAAYRLTDPSVSAVNAPAPREPTTSIDAPDPLSATAWAGGPATGWVTITRPGATRAARDAAVCRARSCSERMKSAT